MGKLLLCFIVLFGVVGFSQGWQQPIYASGGLQVIYDGNGHTSGAVPVDAGAYQSGDTVAISGNSGKLVKEGFEFVGWNTSADGTGTTYSSGTVFAIGTESVTLYAKWAADTPSVWKNLNSSEITPSRVSFVSIDVDNGTPYFAFLDFAQHDGKATVKKYIDGMWKTVGMPGFTPDIAHYLDMVVEDGTPYVGFSDPTHEGKMTVMRYNGAEWETVGTPGFSTSMGTYNSIFVEAGIPYVAYTDVSTSKMAVKRFVDGTWEDLGAHNGFTPGQALLASLYVDNGIPYVAYEDRAKEFKITVQKFDESTGSWMSVGASGPSGSIRGSYPSLYVVDEIPYVSYSETDNRYKMAVKKFNGSEWEDVGTPNFNGGGLGQSSLHIEQGIPVLAYQDSGAKATVRRYVNGQWEVVGTSNFSKGAAMYLSAAVDGNRLYAAYGDRGSNDIPTVMRYTFPAIGALDDLTMQELTAHYPAGTQETKTVTVTRTGMINLSNVTAVIGGVNADAFSITQPASTRLDLTTPFTTFSVKANDDLAAGHYEATITVKADQMTGVTFQVTQTVQPAPTYSVTYDGNGSTGGVVPIDSNAYEQGMNVTVAGNSSQLTKTGHTFAGWNTAADGSGTKYNGGDTFAMPNDDVTLFAMWMLNPTYSVTYDGNGSTGGTVPADNNAYEQGVTVTVAGNSGQLTRAGHTFVGWNTAADGSGTDYAGGETFTMPADNVTLYAKWTTNPTYSVTYDGNGNSGGAVPTDNNAYEQGATVTVAGNSGQLTKSGHTFVGWNTAADGNGTDYAGGETFTMPADNVTLYAKWTTNPTYSVTYDGNGNSGGAVPTDNNAYEQGATVTVAGNSGQLTKSGHTFVGWNTAADGSGTDYAGGETFTMPADNVTLYAKWTTNPTYSVTYDGNGNSGGAVPTDNNAYEQGATVTVAGNSGQLTKAGHTFVGWNTAADGSGTDYAGGETLTMPADNVTLYAKWTANPTYSVTYDVNGSTGGAVPTDNSAYEQGATVTVAGNGGQLTKSGHTFVGWNTAADGSGTDYAGGDTFAMPNDDVTLFAMWSLNPTYSVTYDGNGSTGGTVPTDGNTYEQGMNVTVAGNGGQLTKSGHTFVGWNTTADGNGTDYAGGETLTMPADNVTLFAMWTQNPTYSVTYDGNGSTGGSVPTDNNAYEQGVTVTVAGNSGQLTRAGHTFVGWNTTADGNGTDYAGGDTFTMPADNVTLYAKWTTNPTYSVTYDGNGSTGGAVPTDNSAYEQGATVTVAGNGGQLTKAGHTFVGWNTAADGSGTDYAGGDAFTMPADDVTLYAKWTANPTYSVTYDGNGNSGGAVPTDNNAYEQGATVTVAGDSGQLTKAGHTFVGWNTAADGSGTDYAGGETLTMPADNVTLYAKWTTNPTYSVTYDGNGSTGGSVPTDNNAYEQGVTVSVAGNSGQLTKAGHTFVGWNTAADGSGTDYAGGETLTMPADNVTLYAKWTTNPTYLVTYDGNGNSGGSVPTDNNAYELGATVTVAGNSGQLTKSGRTFAGWNTAADGSGMNYAVGSTFVMPADDITLYAKWTLQTDPGGGTGNGNTGDNAPSLPVTQEGLQFSVNGKLQQNMVTHTTTQIGGQTVVKAEWRADQWQSAIMQAGAHPVIVLEARESVDRISAVLTGEMAKELADRAGQLEIRTVSGIYRLPATALDIASLSQRFGTQLKPADLTILVEVGKEAGNSLTLLEQLEQNGELRVISPPVEFDVKVSYNGITYSMNQFQTYIERELPLNEGVSNNRATTAVVIEHDGTIRHVPTRFIEQDGKRSAVVNSLTNSAYALLELRVTLEDTRTHWAKDAIHNMASRMIVGGVDGKHFRPDASITRAELAAIVIRSLGLPSLGGAQGAEAFADVAPEAWYSGLVAQAEAYGLITGYADGTFRPSQTVTREEAAVILIRAMRLAGQSTIVDDSETETLLAKYADAGEVHAWSKQDVTEAMKHGLLQGTSGNKLNPAQELTRAETAVLVQRMLQQAGLIN
ncbi:InlB B-repeat-containing protein [Paenibacillus nanensis]|nr:InlB B-repeat-containing protein [Paenibacillus nanensis]